MNLATQWAFKIATPLIVGFITPFVVDAIKRANKWLDAAPAYIKQAAAVAVAAIGSALATIAEVGVPADLAAWDETAVKAIIAALLGIAIKQHKQLTSKN